MERRVPLHLTGIDWDNFPDWADRAVCRDDLRVLDRTEGPGTHWWRLAYADREIHLCYDETLDQVWLEPDARDNPRHELRAIAGALEQVSVTCSR